MMTAQDALEKAAQLWDSFGEVALSIDDVARALLEERIAALEWSVARRSWEVNEEIARLRAEREKLT